MTVLWIAVGEIVRPFLETAVVVYGIRLKAREHTVYFGDKIVVDAESGSCIACVDKAFAYYGNIGGGAYACIAGFASGPEKVVLG